MSHRPQPQATRRPPRREKPPRRGMKKATDSYALPPRSGGGSGLPVALHCSTSPGRFRQLGSGGSDRSARRGTRGVILLDNAGLGRSSGEVPPTVAAMARHPMAFLEALQESRGATSSGTRSAGWSRFRWSRTSTVDLSEDGPCPGPRREAVRTSCTSRSRAWRSASRTRRTGGTTS